MPQSRLESETDDVGQSFVVNTKENFLSVDDGRMTYFICLLFQSTPKDTKSLCGIYPSQVDGTSSAGRS